MRRLLTKVRGLWEGSRWVTGECGCRFTVAGPLEFRSCAGHEWAHEAITVRLQRLEVSR